MENSLQFRLNDRRLKLNVSQTIKIQTFEMRIMHSYMIFILSFVHSLLTVPLHFGFWMEV